MKSFMILLLIALCFTGYSNAQNRMALGAGIIISLPIGDFSEGANTGFGGSAAFEMGFTPQLVGVGNIGFITWGTDADDISFTAVPVLVGGKYFFTPGIGFYGLGQIGLSFMSVEVPSFTFGGQTFGGGSETDTEFTLVLGAGYEVPVSPTFMLDFTGGFNVVSDANHITLRAGGKVAL